MSKKEQRRRRNARVRDQEAQDAFCPTPTKTRFEDMSDAISTMAFNGLRVKDGWTVYQCSCGWWHLSSRGTGRLISDQFHPVTA